MVPQGPRGGIRRRSALALLGTSSLVATVAVPLAVGTLLGSGRLDAASSATNSASYAFGEGDFGQLGNGCSPCTGTPVNASPVGVTEPNGVHYTALANGALHTLALGSDGNVYAWGTNDFGQLGNGTTTPSSTPLRVSLPTGQTYTRLAAGRVFSLALTSTGHLYAWGDNFDGQLGNGSTTASPTPVAVSEPTGVTFSAIAAGADFAVALGSDGKVYAWGADNLGQLGNGKESRTPVLTPQPLSLPLSAGVSVKQLAAGSGHALALSSDGSVYAWGDNSAGELGNASFTDSANAVKVAAPAGVTYTAIAAGAVFSEAITGSGSVEEWGSNDYGQLGETSGDNCTIEGPNPATNDCSDIPLAVQGLPPLVPVVAIAAGYSQAYARNAGGQLFAWGGNEYGQIGIGDTTDSSVLVPAKVALPPGDAVNTAQIFSGSQSSFAVAVTGADQQISVPTVGQKTYGDTDFNLGATASSGLPVSLTSDTPGVCHGGGDVVNILGAGTCTLAVTQGGSDIWNPATVTESFTVNKAPLTVRASNEQVSQGSTPSFGYTLSGFVRGDTVATAHVTGTPSCSSTATPSSPPGKYPITCTVGSLSAPNYFFANFVGATLTITAKASGYHMVGTDGGVFSFGGAGFFGSTGGIHLNQPIVGMASTPDGNGYWMVAADGGIFAFGDAAFYGSTGAIQLNKPVVGMASGPDGHGYWLVASDGGIFAFGDAPFLGSTGALTLNQPIVGMKWSGANGYWMVAADGGIFSFGNAPFYGSTADLSLGARVVGMLRNPDGPGYWIATAAGAVYAFGCPQLGSLAGIPLNAPIVGIG